ncbi:MAG: zinc ABC transporter substrate-binding protein [Candidatus Limnocylindrales bacterium]|jgi:zinc/manganese transport system substrate-binding protein|nr:zinc ABC transporter substrate-binding protein [Candidatus Limnocylindrales bacterium]
MTRSAPGSEAPASSVAIPSPIDAGPPIPVLGTENFYADLLTQIGGTRVSATSLLNDPNADPHAFEASPAAAVAVADAKLVILNGLGYDDFMQHLLGASPNASRVVINVEQLLGLGSDANAHVWYDPGTMPAVAASAEAALATLEPANAAYFAAREQAYLASLAPLAAKIAELKAKYSGAPVAFTEPVAGYLAKAIGLAVLTPEGFQRAVEDGTDPAPADVAAERDLLTGKKVRVLLFNSQVITPLTTQIHDLAIANGIPVVGVAETLPPQYQTYQAWQLAQMNELEAALAKGS